MAFAGREVLAVRSNLTAKRRQADFFCPLGPPFPRFEQYMKPPPTLFSWSPFASDVGEPPSLPIVLFLLSLAVARERTAPAVELSPMVLVAWLSDLHEGVRWGRA